MFDRPSCDVTLLTLDTASSVVDYVGRSATSQGGVERQDPRRDLTIASLFGWCQILVIFSSADVRERG